MNLDLLFKQYYFQYRTEASTPADSDDEYIIFVGLANEAVNRWANYDNTFWKELYSTNQTAVTGADSTAVGVINANQLTYATPSNFRIAGGYLRIYNPNTGITQARYKIVESQDVQWQGDTANYVYFIGDPNNGFTMHINPVPKAPLIGCSFDYVYYKIPDLLANANDSPQMSQPYFIVHRALAMRFRGSRNPYYKDAKNDAEDILKTMQMENNSGSWADPWQLADHTGGTFGSSTGHGQGDLLL